MKSEHSVVEVSINCSRCPWRESHNIRWEKNQEHAEINWKCPQCGAEKRMVHTRQEPSKKMESAPPVSQTRLKMNPDGSVSELDQDGNPLKKEKGRFSIRGLGKDAD